MILNDFDKMNADINFLWPKFEEFCEDNYVTIERLSGTEGTWRMLWSAFCAGAKANQDGQAFKEADEAKEIKEILGM